MKGTTSVPPSLCCPIYSTGSTLVPCGPAQRDTRLCLPGEKPSFWHGTTPPSWSDNC